MAFTTEALDTSIPSAPRAGPSEFDLPVKEFIGYDPKGTTTITGSAISENKSPKQTDIPVDDAPASEEVVALSPKISALARKEQAQRQRELALKRREAELADKLAKAERFEQLQAKLANKDYSAAEELGLEYDKYAEYKVKELEGKDPREERFLKTEKELEELRQRLEEKENQEYQFNQQLWKHEISKTLESEEFVSLKKQPKVEDLILRHINDSFDEDDVRLSPEEAARDIKAFLKERAKRLAPFLEDDQQASGNKVLGPPKSSPKTITQNMTVTPKTTTSKPFHLMSESEQIAEAYRRVQAAKLQR